MLCLSVGMGWKADQVAPYEDGRRELCVPHAGLPHRIRAPHEKPVGVASAEIYQGECTCACCPHGRSRLPPNGAPSFRHRVTGVRESDPERRRGAMLTYALIFLLLGLIAGALGMAGVASVATQIAWVLFIVGLVLLVIHLASGR